MHYFQDRLADTRPAVEALFADRVDQGLTPSTVYAVFDRDGIRYAAGFGDRGDGNPPTVDTGYRIASCTKSITAAALLIMVERGLVSLDDSVDSLLTLGALIGPDGDEVRPPTLRELVGMAGGLPTDDPWADRQESMSTEQFAAVVAGGMRLTSAPGQRYEYSNLGFALIGAVIEKVSGRGYVELVTEELIKPLGLTGVGYDVDVPGVDAVATGFVRRDDQWQPQPFSTPGAFSPIGGVFASPSGLSRWIGWLSSGFIDTDDEDQPLGRLSRRLMQTAQTSIGPTARGAQAYGMGLVVDDDERHGTIAGHSGGYPGFGSHMRWHPETGIGVLALENARYAGPRASVTHALDLILDEICRPDDLPVLWPETITARETVEGLLRNWDPAVAERLFADNVDLDEPLGRRAAQIAELVRSVEPSVEPVALADASPVSRTAAQLAWTVPGRTGALRCEVTLTPTVPPRVQTLVVRRA